MALKLRLTKSLTQGLVNCYIVRKPSILNELLPVNNFIIVHHQNNI